ncbi:isomerizing glutamine--fructose-6-phosphate transaminase [Trichocoleus sp. ST-U3]|uniref:isomerizing glutamine--fructose-6-phosphate transaminase n=1 Tax=Coleofasciculus sp. FACHB-542 TaxID=2692787 RepID=UPI0032201911
MNSPKEKVFSHFMLKEIHEQSEVVRTCLEAFSEIRFNDQQPRLELTQQPLNLGLSSNFYDGIDQIKILACGSSLHASLVGKYLLEQVAKVPTSVHYASEFRDAPSPATPNTLIVGVTQSGETADTLAALEIEKQHCSGETRFLGITNQAGSSLEKLVDRTIHTLAGSEVAIAATKTFVAQLIAFYCWALDVAYCRQTLSSDRLHQILTQLHRIPDQIDLILQSQKHVIEQLAKDFTHTQNCIILGRGINFPITLEAALKLKETSYMHATGYHAGEFLHGPIAMLDSSVTVVAIAMPGVVYEKILANAQKAKARGVQLIGVTSTNNPEITGIFDRVLTVPEADELLSPILTVIPLQLLAYYAAVHRGLDVDRPRNLTKTLAVD